MSPLDLPGAEHLGKQLLIAMPQKKFLSAFAIRLGDYSKESVTKSEPHGDRIFHFILGGLVAIEDEKGNWSLFESANTTAHRLHIDAWAEFSRGFWSPEVPDKAGTYPTRDKAKRRSTDRELRLFGDQLKDVTRGFVGPGKVSEWVGDWWSVAYPPLPGAD